MSRRPFFVPRDPAASAPLPEDFESMVADYETEELEMPAKRTRSYHLVKLSRDAAECLSELPAGDRFGDLVVANGKATLKMKGDIIPGLKPQSFALTVMEQRPYSAYMTVDEENKEAAIEGVFADRRTMRAEDRTVAIENQQALEERDLQSLRAARMFGQRKPAHGNTQPMKIEAPEEPEEGEEEGEFEEEPVDADRELVERRVVNCFMQKQYWTMQQLRRTLGFSAERIKHALQSLLCVYHRRGEYHKHWELNEDKKKLYKVNYA